VRFSFGIILEASIGVIVKAVKRENMVAIVTVTANSLKKRPTIEVIVAIGKNTTILVKVDARTAVPISLVPI